MTTMEKKKLFACFVLSLPFRFLYIYIFYPLLVIKFSFRLKFFIIFFKFYLFTGLYIIYIALTCITTFTNFWHLIMYFFKGKIKLTYNNFYYINVRFNKLWSHEHIYNILRVMWKNFVVNIMDRNYDVITFISKYLYFKEAWSRQICWYHQNCNHVDENNL